MCCMCLENNDHTSEDAFFRHMTKPKMTGFGEVYVFSHNLKFSYYEGKEYEVRLTDKKPGQLSLGGGLQVAGEGAAQLRRHPASVENRHLVVFPVLGGGVLIGL